MGAQYPQPTAARPQRQTCTAETRATGGRLAAAMPSRSVALAALFYLFASLTHAAEFIGAWDWLSEDPDHGGFSGFELSPDGADFTAITDRGRITQGRLERLDGRITGLASTPFERLLGPSGLALSNERSDSEGLAVAPDGRIYVSFERRPRVWLYTAHSARPLPLPRNPDFSRFQNNAALEALAIGADGALYTLPERSGSRSFPFPVWRFAEGVWTRPFTLPRRGAHLPVALDFGPDGRLYLLERQFAPLASFSTRLRRFGIGPTGLTQEETLLETPFGTHDNLEGLAVWRAPDGLRVTMISDDNFRRLQRTQIVEYRVPD